MSSRASSFGRRAADYDRVRPDYPPEAVDLAVSRLGLGPESEVLDLGAGTGKLTRPLAERVGRVIAVEPDPGMRAILSQATDRHPVLEGRAEAIPLADDSVDAVFVGQAFHWFATEQALAEIARVLRPRGGLATIWNHWWETESLLPPAAAALLQRVRDRPGLEAHSMETDDWRDCFARSAFDELREDTVEWEPLDLAGEELVSLILTTSICGSLQPDELDAVERELRELVVGRFRLPIVAGLYSTRLSE